MAVGSDLTEVLIIGPGVSVLGCAALLAPARREVRVWEAFDDVGARTRTDRDALAALASPQPHAGEVAAP